MNMASASPIRCDPAKCRPPRSIDLSSILRGNVSRHAVPAEKATAPGARCNRSIREGERVAKLAAARKRKREREGRCEGRKPLNETRPEVVSLARKLRRRKPKAGQLSLRGVASELAARGFLNERGKPYAAKSVARMLA